MGAIFFLGAAAGSLGAPTEIIPGAPRVIETTPTIGQEDVSPALTRIQVQFDRPMRQTSWSWCGGGYAYPEITDRPRFISSTIAELPVKLEAQHTYAIGINCSSAKGFVSIDGMSVEPVGLNFRTAATAEEFGSADIRNHKAWKEFRKAFRERYSYYERTGTEWEALFDEATANVLSSPTPQEFALRVALLLRPADDPHMYLRLPDESRISTHKRRGWVNANADAIERAFPGLRHVNDLTIVGRADDVGYFAPRAWNYSEAQLDEASRALEELLDAPVLIVDVRENGGGNENQALRIAAYFVAEPRIYETHRWRDPEAAGGWGPLRNRWVYPHPEKHYGGRVLLLQGAACLSSNEAFIMMMRQAPHTTTLGVTTGGSSGNPQRYELSNGVTAIIPGWRAMTPEGTDMEGIGIEPNVTVNGDFSSEDPVLERALEMARERL